MIEYQFTCNNEGRRLAVEQQTQLNGIEYLEVSANQSKLKVHFVHPLPVRAKQVPPVPALALTKENIRIEGGVQVRDIQVVAVSDTANILTVTVSERGDFSTYTLRLVTSVTNDAPPPGYDPYLSTLDFSFKVTCPTNFDCKPDTVCPPEQFEEPEIDYLAKDFTTFRRLMLDRLSVTMPDWKDRSIADQQIALVELLAYVGDHLSYYQDAVATEAYLGTARRRVSVRRHARMLDYVIHDGCNARVWVHLNVIDGDSADNSTLPVHAELRTGGDAPLVFETMHETYLSSVHNEIYFYTWDDYACCLPKGSTRATLADSGASPLKLKVGDVLIFEEICSPSTGLEADADMSHRHAVRLLEVNPGTDILNLVSIVEIVWHEDDALPFPLCLNGVVTQFDGSTIEKDISIARGNVVLADEGRTITNEALYPAIVTDEKRYSPHLLRTNVVFAQAYSTESAKLESAGSAIRQNIRNTLPIVTLTDADETWNPKRDLLGSDRFSPEFVVEMENDGLAYLRFGDDILGKAPSKGTAFNATYRIGNGPQGNVGPEAINTIIGVVGIEFVRNPMAAAGGSAAESMEEVREYAPQAFRTQERAVTEQDYAEVAQRFKSVQRATARFRWTGSWYTVFITVDRIGGKKIDDRFRAEFVAHMNRYRMAGYDMKVSDPVFVSLDVMLSVCVTPGYFQSNVKQALLDVLSNRELPDGRRGFFHPDNFTFGQPLYLSRLYQTALGVKGVESVDVKRFQRWGKTANDELEHGEIVPASLEVIMLDNDPSEQENGKLELEMHGGL